MERSGGIYLKLVAIVVGIALTSLSMGIGAYIGSLYGPDDKQYQAGGTPTGTDNNYNGPSESLPDIAGIGRPIERIIANPPPKTGEDHEKRDLAAQEAMAVWAFWMVCVSAATGIVSTFGLVALFVTIRQNREAIDKARVANNIARDIGEAQARAHLSIKHALCTISKNYIRLNVDVENNGASPATDIRCRLFVSVYFRYPSIGGAIPEQVHSDGPDISHDLGVCTANGGLAKGEFLWAAPIVLPVSFADIQKAFHVGGHSFVIDVEGFIEWVDVFGKKQDIWISLAASNFDRSFNGLESVCSIKHSVMDVDAKLRQFAEEKR